MASKFKNKPPYQKSREDLLELAKRVVDPRTGLDLQIAANDPRSPLFKQMAAVASEKHLDQEDRVLSIVEFLANLSIDEKERLQAEMKIELIKEEQAAAATRDAQVQAEAKQQQQIINQMIEQQRQEAFAKEQQARTAAELKEVIKGLAILTAGIIEAKEELKVASTAWDKGRDVQTEKVVAALKENNIEVKLPNSDKTLSAEQVAQLWQADEPSVPIEKKMEYNPALKEFMQNMPSQGVNYENVLDQFKKTTTLLTSTGQEFSPQNMLTFINENKKLNALIGAIAKEEGPANEQHLKDVLVVTKKLDNLTAQFNMQEDKYSQLNNLLSAQLLQMHPEAGEQLISTWKANAAPINTQLAGEEGLELAINMKELDGHIRAAEANGKFTPESQVKVVDLINKISKQEAELGVKAKGSLINDLSSLVNKDYSADEKLSVKSSMKH